MKKSLLFVAFLAVAAQGQVFAAEQAAAPAAAPLGIKGDWALSSMTAKVVAINKETRAVTLEKENGKRVKITAGDEVRNFNQIAVGDLLVVKHTEALAVSVYPTEPGAIGRTETIGVSRADLGQKPHGAIERTVDITARITALDKATRKATLEGSEYEVTLRVADDVDLSNIKVGDTVGVKYVESLAIDVNKP